MQSLRKIIHIDMDAFYASVEQRENPKLIGKPVIVGGSPHSRGVVATCSYEARKFGIHSAMSSKKAYQLCPQAIFIRPRMEVYKQVSQEIMDIFYSYTDLVEPLSLDEAFLDVTNNKQSISSATLIAREIKQQIYKKTKLTASAGVSFNKFIAKIASGYRKPNGLTIVTPQHAQSFLDVTPIRDFFGIGKVTEKKLNRLGVHTGADLRKWSEAQLINLLGKRGKILFQNIRGEDDRPVNPQRIRKSIGKEITLKQDLDYREQMSNILFTLAESIETYLDEKNLAGKVVVLKIKFHDFQQITRRMTVAEPIQSAESIMKYIQVMMDKLDFTNRKVRLLGISIADLVESRPEVSQLSLFELSQIDL